MCSPRPSQATTFTLVSSFLSFSIRIDQPFQLTLNVTNLASSPLTLTQYVITNQYKYQKSLLIDVNYHNVTIYPGSQLSINLQFLPISAGKYDDSLLFLFYFENKYYPYQFSYNLK